MDNGKALAHARRDFLIVRWKKSGKGKGMGVLSDLTGSAVIYATKPHTFLN